uniref:Conserved secreted protein n=1 Tax=Panagrellus redivivus TaxID=6233 RepID=A0A7E4V5P4_PANRE
MTAILAFFGLFCVVEVVIGAPKHFEPNGFTNNFGYGPHGIGPTNGGFDSFGFYKDKFYNSGLPPKYTWASYRNYYREFMRVTDRSKFPGFMEEFAHIVFYGRGGAAEQKVKYELKQQDRFGPYYNGVWGYADHSPHWYGKR